MNKNRQMLEQIPVDEERLEASRLIDCLTTPLIDLRPVDRTKDLSSNFRPSQDGPLDLKDLSPADVLNAVNIDLPESWKKQISEISFKIK